MQWNDDKDARNGLLCQGGAASTEICELRLGGPPGNRRRRGGLLGSALGCGRPRMRLPAGGLATGDWRNKNKPQQPQTAATAQPTAADGSRR
jgi:hypothetical protein